MAARDLTVLGLARLLGCDPKTPRRWLELGYRPKPDLRRLAAEVLGVEPGFLWPEEGGDL